MYQRIYNKQFHNPNGTLINNWFEEEELRKKTGVSRATTLQNFPHKFFDFENPIKNTNPHDDTFKRVINDEHNAFYKTTYSTYGNHPNPEKKYEYKGEDKKEFDEYVNNKILTKNLENFDKSPVGLYESVTKSTIIPQKNNDPKGQRLMKTQDYENIPEERKDRIFQSENGLCSKIGSIPNNDFKEAFQDYKIPYYKDKPLTYWAMNQNRTNVYHTASNGLNSFGRSNNFTQNVQNTRGVSLYNGNIINNQKSQEVFLDKKDDEFIEDYKNYQLQRDEKEASSIESCFEKGNMKICEKFLSEIKNKIIGDIRKKGWTGLRKLKLYLQSVVKNINYYKSNLIEKTEFKYHIYKWGVVSLNDKEIDLIFKMFGKKYNNTIDFVEFFNSLHTNCDENRKNMIKRLMIILKKNANDEYIHFSGICKYMNLNLLPEVLRLDNHLKKAEKEFIQSWGDLKEDDIITEENFFEYFEDISTCFAFDDEFEQCLLALSYYYYNKK